MPWVLIAVGTFLRVRQYFFDRSLWVDEASLARNIVSQSFAGLFHPLNYDQTAPIGFLLLSKLATAIGGNNSLALRFFPLVFGILSVYLFYRVTKHLLKKQGMLIALAFFVLETPYVYYSTEFKQYMTDVFCTLLLWYIAFVHRPKRVWIVALTGAVILWFSNASVFILTAIGLVSPALWVSAVPFWLASFGLNYFVSLRYYLANASLVDFWHSYFIPYPWDFASVDTIVQFFRRTIGYFIEDNKPWIQLLVMIVGFVYFAKRRLREFFIIFFPIVLIIIASMLGKYPFVPRLLLFIAPSLYIAMGAGADVVYSIVKKYVGRVPALIAVTLLSGFLLWKTMGAAYSILVKPIAVEELRQVLSYVSQKRRPSDTIYVYYGAEAAFAYYASDFGMDKANVIYGRDFRNDVYQYQEDIKKLKGSARVWIISSHVYMHFGVGEDRIMTAYLDRVGRRLDFYPQVGASAYLYDLRDGPTR